MFPLPNGNPRNIWEVLMIDKAFLLYLIHIYVISNYLVDSLICLNLCRHNGNWQYNFPLKIVNGWLNWAIHLLPNPFLQISYATSECLDFENIICIHSPMHINWFACSFCGFQICICCVKFFISNPKWFFYQSLKNTAGVKQLHIKFRCLHKWISIENAKSLEKKGLGLAISHIFYLRSWF